MTRNTMTRNTMTRKKRRSRFAIQSSGINPKGFHPSQIKFYVILAPLVAFMLLPIVFVFSHAFKPPDELFEYPPNFLVSNPTTKNFTDLFARLSTSGIPITRYLFNSLLITVVTIAASILVSSTAAYALSKKQFKLKDTLFAINTLALMFVPIAVTIPRFLVIERMGLMNTFLVHILPVLALPVGLFLIKQFMDGIPNEMIEAARVDGASDLQIYWKIILPLVKPALATLAILTFQFTWNDATSSTLYINDESLKSFAFFLTTLTSTVAGANAVAGQGMAAAATLIMFLPNLIVFAFLQTQVMNTMSHSGLKG